METRTLPDKEKKERMAYTSFVVHEFAEAYKMEIPKGYRYLKKYGGLDFTRKHWWVLHTDNQRHVIREIFDLCKENGGYMR